MLKLYNTLSKSVEEFKPINSGKVGIYTCGPTVYHYQHIGNYRRYLGDDFIIRTLRASGLEVKQVMNITDVGHLTSDEDSGEDKMEKGAREMGQTVWEIAKYFEDDFWRSMGKLNIERPNVVALATEHITKQIKLIEELEKKGFTYQTEHAIYFDVSKFPNYTQLSGQKLEEKETGSREDVITDKDKKHPYDFALWFFTIGHFKDHTMKWSSPWGEGFPGWHIECSAMSMEYLGNTFDIHTGGVDHIPVHHTNEIAQSEAATGEKFVNYWVHHEFLMVNNQKMSKSLKNLFTIKDIEEKGIDPLTFRYLVLTVHYRDKLNFTWESLQSAQNALNNLKDEISSWEVGGEISTEYYDKFLDALNNDFNTPQALALMWKLVKSDLPTDQKSATLIKMDQVLGLNLSEFIGKQVEIPEEVAGLVEKREHARLRKDFKDSDLIRHQIRRLGFEVLDTPTGPKVKKLP